MFAAANLLRPVNMAEGNIINGENGWREMPPACRCDLAHRIALLAPTVVRWPLATIGDGRSPRRAQAASYCC